MSADKNPTTSAALMAERDRKIASRNAMPGLSVCCFLVEFVVVNFIPRQQNFCSEKSKKSAICRAFSLSIVTVI